jgi:transcriptional regulator with XRE-family HTH domain
MSGRPKRVSDIELAERLRARRAAARVSFSEMAGGLGVATSTLTRSLKQNSFSKDLGERVREMLEDPAAFEARHKVPSFAKIESKKLTGEDLQILHKIVNLMPKVEVILRNLVKRPARRDRT